MIEDCELSGKAYEGRDLLSLRLFSHYPPSHRIHFDYQ
jgi:hypothetical protein